MLALFTAPLYFIQTFGWYLLFGFLLYYFFWDRRHAIKDKVLTKLEFPTANDGMSRIGSSSEMSLHEIRAKQQQQFMNAEKKTNPDTKDPKPTLSNKEDNMSKESADSS
eukprot:356965_1